MNRAAAHEERGYLMGLVRPMPDDLRRIAELTEVVSDMSAALPWWQKAAEAGDRDAIDYLKLVHR